MSELTLSKQFAIIALNGLDSTRMTAAKKAALRCIMAAPVLEQYMAALPPAESSEDFAKRLREVSSASVGGLKKAENSIRKELMNLRLIKEAPNLLACDMNYVTANVTIWEYYSDPAEYEKIKDEIHDRLAGSGGAEDEVVSMFWLLRESGCFYDMFTEQEEDLLEVRIRELYDQSSFAKTLFPIVIQKPFEQACRFFLRKKKECFSTPLGTGLLFRCPMLERSQSVFIEVEEWFSNKDKRLDCVLNRLVTMGQEVQIIRTGSVPLLKINNLFYECIPDQVMCKLPIQGVRLRRYFPAETAAAAD